MSRGKALPATYSWKTVVSILSWLFSFQSCVGHMHHFEGCLVVSYPWKLFSFQFAWVFTHFLSLTQLLQLNLTINIRYKRLNKITIKFGTKLKPTKQIVVNYNFTSRNHIYSVLSRKDLWSYYQSMGSEFRYALGKVSAPKIAQP